jgi:integrase
MPSNSLFTPFAFGSALPYESRGRMFESCRVYQQIEGKTDSPRFSLFRYRTIIAPKSYPKWLVNVLVKKRSYRKYVAEIDGKKYAVVRLPIGNGKYKKKVKLLDLIGGTKEDAVKWAWSELDKLKEKHEPRRTFQSLADWYRDEYLIPPVYQKGKRLYGLRTWKHQRVVLKRLSARFGIMPLDKITVDVLENYKRSRLQSVSVSSTNREFALLRTMFLKARKRKWMLESPFEVGENLIDMSLETHRVSPINTRIAKRLLARSRKSGQPLLHYLILVMMFTGARPSEVFPYNAKDDDVPREPLTWARILEFNFQGVRLVSYKGRIREEKLVPALPTLERGLRRFYAETNPKPEDLLFPVKNFKRSWATLCRSVGVSGIWIRDFRKFFNSWVAQLPDMSDVDRMMMLGHKKLETNVIYTKAEMPSLVKKFRAAVQDAETDFVA